MNHQTPDGQAATETLPIQPLVDAIAMLEHGSLVWAGSGDAHVASADRTSTKVERVFAAIAPKAVPEPFDRAETERMVSNPSKTTISAWNPGRGDPSVGIEIETYSGSIDFKMTRHLELAYTVAFQIARTAALDRAMEALAGDDDRLRSLFGCAVAAACCRTGARLCVLLRSADARAEAATHAARTRALLDGAWLVAGEALGFPPGPATFTYHGERPALRIEIPAGDALIVELVDDLVRTLPPRGVRVARHAAADDGSWHNMVEIDGVVESGRNAGRLPPPEAAAVIRTLPADQVRLIEAAASRIELPWHRPATSV